MYQLLSLPWGSLDITLILSVELSNIISFILSLLSLPALIIDSCLSRCTDAVYLTCQLLCHSCLTRRMYPCGSRDHHPRAFLVSCKSVYRMNDGWIEMRKSDICLK